MISAEEALQRLRDGNERFVSKDAENKLTATRTHIPDMAGGQNPFAIILACSDSRVPPEIIFDQGIGDLFVIRVAGNVATPAQIGSIEYAATQLGTKLVVVLGHSNCGAVAATLDAIRSKEEQPSPNLQAIVDCIRPAVESLVASGTDDDSKEVLMEAVPKNIGASVERLQHGSLIVESLIRDDELEIVGAEYSIENGAVQFF